MIGQDEKLIKLSKNICYLHPHSKPIIVENFTFVMLDLRLSRRNIPHGLGFENIQACNTIAKLKLFYG